MFAKSALTRFLPLPVCLSYIFLLSTNFQACRMMMMMIAIIVAIVVMITS